MRRPKQNLSPGTTSRLFIGTAGWNIPAHFADHFSRNGSQIERYSSLLNCVEINSSFHRPHRRQTYERWAGSTPEEFHFSVKIPRTITHEHHLIGCEALIDRFLGETDGLGEKLGAILVQLPPSLAFDAGIVSEFFAYLRGQRPHSIVCEPRHASWFGRLADKLLTSLGIARVGADPARAGTDASPGGWRDLVYYRMHGSPKLYYSNYGDDTLTALATAIRKSDASRVWCIFDNTAAFAALGNALTLQQMCPKKA